MKRILIMLLLLSCAAGIWADFKGKIVELDLEAEFYDIRADNLNVVHIIWIGNKMTNYGQLRNDEIINREQIDVRGIGTRKMRPRIAVKPDDGSQVHFCWVRPYIGPVEVHNCYRDFNESGGTWHEKTVFSTGGSNFQFPTVGVDNNGVAHITFVKMDKTSLMPILYSRKPPGGDWEPAIELVPKTAKNIWPHLYVDNNGGVHLAWSVEKYTLKYIYAPLGEKLQDQKVEILPKLHSKNQQPEIFVDRENNVHIASLSYEPPGHNCFFDYTTKKVGDPEFKDPVSASVVAFKVWFHKPYPAIGAASAEQAWLAWAFENDSGHITNGRLCVLENGVWNFNKIDNHSLLHEEDGRYAITTTDSYVYIVWRHDNGKLWLYKEPLVGVFAPLNVTGTRELNRTLFRIEDSIRLNWEPNPDNADINIIKHRIYYFDGSSKILAGEVGANETTFLHRNVDKDKAYTYDIVAVAEENGDEVEGIPAQITVQ